MFISTRCKRMYVPKQKPVPIIPVPIQRAKNTITTAFFAFIAMFGLGSMTLYQYLYGRHHKKSLGCIARKGGKRVVIVGGGAAGCTCAATLSQHLPNAEIVVIEKSRELVFSAMIPYANCGHRSYDLSTKGPNSLFASTAKCVTSDADLLFEDVTKIDPDNKVVHTAEGQTHPYDYLVLALGAQTDYDAVKGLNKDTVDKHAIFVSPHAVRDGILNLHTDNLIISRVLSKYQALESAKKRHTIRYVSSSLENEEGEGHDDGIFLSAMDWFYRTFCGLNRKNNWTTTFPVTQESLEKMRRRKKIENETLQRSSGGDVHSIPSTPADESIKGKEEEEREQPFPLSWFHNRNSDSSFVGSVGLIRKYINFFQRNKPGGIKVIVTTGDSTPCDDLPLIYRQRVIEFWNSKELLDFRPNWNLVSVDTMKKEATFEVLERVYAQDDEKKKKDHVAAVAEEEGVKASSLNTVTPSDIKKRKETVSYKAMVLELPWKAPDLISKSGLSSKAAMGYADVDAQSLQHRKYPEIFALGDCAALDVPRSYGAVFAQVPVLVHNLTKLFEHHQSLENSAAASTTEEENVESVSSHVADAVVTNTKKELLAQQKKNKDSYQDFHHQKSKRPSLLPGAVYNGYSSFNLVLSPYRAIWPETERGNKRVNYHLWDNAEINGWQPLLNGFYIQSTVYETMQWFLFLKGWWYPPLWFGYPDFEEVPIIRT